MKENILFQLDMCWQLYLYHIDTLEEEEALWAFRASGLQVRKAEDGYHVDWPETESYELGTPSIAWTLWHIIYWWSTALDCNFGEGTLKKEDVPWPGSVEKAKATINDLHDKWPLPDRSFSDTALWLDGELMKNAAEIGYGRFLYQACKDGKRHEGL